MYMTFKKNYNQNLVGSYKLINVNYKILILQGGKYEKRIGYFASLM